MGTLCQSPSSSLMMMILFSPPRLLHLISCHVMDIQDCCKLDNEKEQQRQTFYCPSTDIHTQCQTNFSSLICKSICTWLFWLAPMDTHELRIKCCFVFMSTNANIQVMCALHMNSHHRPLCCCLTWAAVIWCVTCQCHNNVSVICGFREDNELCSSSSKGINKKPQEQEEQDWSNQPDRRDQG